MECYLALKGLGWRWQRWITAILVGANLGMVIFFVPETRFYRNACRTVAEGPTNEPADVANTESQGPKDEPIQDPEKASNTRRRALKELIPWSDIDRNASYLNLFLRPFPLVFYPACAFAALGCRYPRLYGIFVDSNIT